MTDDVATREPSLPEAMRVDTTGVPDNSGAGGHRPQRWVRATMAAQCLSVVAYLVLIMGGFSGWDAVRDVWVGNLVFALPVLLCLARAATATGPIRWSSLAFGAGCLSFLLGNVAYVTYVAYLDPMPVPSLADAGYLGASPCLAAGVLVLARAELARRMRSGLWLDGVVGLLGTAAVGSVLGLRVILANLEGSLAVLVTAGAYPVGDLVLVSVVTAVITLHGGRPGRVWWWLGAGLLLFAAADTIYLYRVAVDAYALGTPLDALWCLGLTAVGFGVWQGSGRGGASETGGRAALVLPVGSSLAALAILAVSAGAHVHVPPYSVVLATGAILAAGSRTAMSFRAVQQLVESRAEARTDDLTGLPNRRAFYEEAEAGVAEAGPSAQLSLLLLDLNRFKEINDSLGHGVGDDLLRLVGRRLADAVRSGDRLARLGGDEFAVLLPGASASAARDLAERLALSLRTPYRVNGVDLSVSASIGIATYPDHADGVSRLLQRADIAMYQAKRAHRDVAVFDPERDHDERERMAVIEDLRVALDRDELVLHYQPQVDIRTGSVAAVEALVRWQHPTRGLLYPDAFLPLVEQTGLMPALTLRVLDKALTQCGQWRMDGLDVSVAVNLSVSNLLDERLPVQVATLLARSGVPSRALNLEITENTLMVDPDRATQTLVALRDLGVVLSIDDYGTGYCSLAYLRDLPVQELKLDKSFLQGIVPGSRANAIVASTIELAHALGLRMVAEGVEDGEALALLESNDCDLAQGYHYARPLPAESATAWLRDHYRSADELLEPYPDALGR